mgnify:CR=1 FL=1
MFRDRLFFAPQNLLVDNIKRIEEYDYYGKHSFSQEYDTRYFFGPIAIPIKKGHGYYQNRYATFNFANYAISDNFSIGGGFEFITTITIGEPLCFLTPKFGMKVSEKVHVGAGVFVMGFSEGYANLPYSVVTLGSSEASVTVGVGYAFHEGERANDPLIMFATTHRISNRISILMDNYFISGDLWDKMAL